VIIGSPSFDMGYCNTSTGFFQLAKVRFYNASSIRLKFDIVDVM
jgi:hypothetical protein